MNLRRWDVVFVRADERDEVGHPAVVLSHEDLLQDDKFQRINVVMGSKKPPAASPAPRQVMLNGADGLEFLTAVVAIWCWWPAKARSCAGSALWVWNDVVKSNARCGLILAWADR